MNQPETAQGLVDQLIEKAGRIDVLINNAGAGMTGPIEETDLWKRLSPIFPTNLFGPLVLIQKVLPVMRKTKFRFGHQYHFYWWLYGAAFSEVCILLLRGL